MRSPAWAFTRNLVWSTDGHAWAVWQIPTAPYLYQSTDRKLRTHAAIRSALTALSTPALWLSVCHDTTIDDLTAATTARPDPDAASRIADQLESLQGGTPRLFARRTYLAIQLPAVQTTWQAMRSRASRELTRLTGLATLHPDADLVAAHLRQANRLTAKMSSLPGMVAVPPAELQWLYARLLARSIAPPILPGPDIDVNRGAAAPIFDAVVHEGGTKTDRDRPDHRRYVRVSTVDGVAFQTVLAIADLPSRWEFPGGLGEWFAAVDAAPWPVDWAAWIRPIPNARARDATKRQARELTNQVDEYDGEPAGPPASLAEAAAAVAAEQAELEAAPAIPELKTTMLFSVSGATLLELEDQAQQLAGLFEGSEYLLPRPTGCQADLLAAMLPGGRVPTACRDYLQHLLPRDLASSIPTNSGHAGDAQGMLLGVNVDAPGTPVLFDPAAGPASRRSGSLAVFGALGAGKSYLIKRCAHATVDRHGRVIVVDPTEAGEYAALAAVMPGRSQVISLDADTDACLDPLVVFDRRDDRVRYAVGFLSQLVGAAPLSPAGITLSEAVAAVVDRGGRLVDVVDELGNIDGRDAADLARTLRYLADEPMARVAFGTAPPLELSADYIVLRTPRLSLPDRDQLDRPDAANQLLPEQLVSQALLYLVAAVARQVTFRDARFAVALFDEAWSLTRTAAGRALLLEGVRDGRKHNAAVWLSSQHPDDLGDPRLADLLGPRFVFRLAGQAATGGLNLLGLKDAPQWRDLVTTDDIDGLPSGTCMFRDLDGRVVRVAVAPAASAALEEAFDTNPADTSTDITTGRHRQTA